MTTSNDTPLSVDPRAIEDVGTDGDATIFNLRDALARCQKACTAGRDNTAKVFSDAELSEAGRHHKAAQGNRKIDEELQAHGEKVLERAGQEVARLRAKLVPPKPEADDTAAVLARDSMQRTIAAMSHADREKWIGEMIAANNTEAVNAYMAINEGMLGGGDEGKLARLAFANRKTLWLKRNHPETLARIERITKAANKVVLGMRATSAYFNKLTKPELVALVEQRKQQQRVNLTEAGCEGIPRMLGGVVKGGDVQPSQPGASQSRGPRYWCDGGDGWRADPFPTGRRTSAFGGKPDIERTSPKGRF